MQTDPRLQQAIKLIHTGKKAEAQPILSALIKENPNNADNWYYAAAVASGERRLDFLKRALAIDPNHDRARVALGDINSTPIADEEDDPVANKKEESIVHFIVRILLGIAALLIGAYFGWMAFDNMLRGSVFTVDIGDVVLALRAIFYLIAAIAVLFFAGALLKSPNT